MATLVNTFGKGAVVTAFALCFTRVVGLRPTQVGLALSPDCWSRSLAGTWLAIALLCAGTLVHVVGEMLGSGGHGECRWAWPRENGRDSTKALPAWVSRCRTSSPRRSSRWCALNGADPAGSPWLR